MPPHTTSEPLLVTATPERIRALADTLLEKIRASIKEIADINLQARILAINAQIEAARAGQAGRSFAIVGQEMVNFSTRTQQAARTLEQETEGLVLELAEISRQLATDVRGTRMGDLALTNIDLIDRNLYERTCDCRWWATDDAIVAALNAPGDSTVTAHAAQRLAVILKAYTVYFDIVLADLHGVIVANGRPAEYKSAGTVHHDARWFQSALATATGDQFGFESAHVSSLAGGKRVLIYSCKVCQGGNASAPPLGVLGVVFNWDGLAQKIVHDTPLEPDQKETTRVCIVDELGSVLADSQEHGLQEKISFPGREALFAQKKGCTIVDGANASLLIAHAQSPGFETYRTGWHSLIIETRKN